MKVWTEFRQFIARGNLMDLAVGIMIGSAFNSLVQSLVKDIVSPVVGLIVGKMDLSHWSVAWSLSGNEEPVVMSYGRFLQAGLDFILMALVIFIIVKSLSKIKRKAEDEKNTELPMPKDLALLAEIRDLLKAKGDRL